MRRMPVPDASQNLQNETSQTQRVMGRSPEQPSPKCCSIARLRFRWRFGNGTDGPDAAIQDFPILSRWTTIANRSATLGTRAEVAVMQLGAVLFFPFFSFGFILYFLPSIVALVRAKRDTVSIVL